MMLHHHANQRLQPRVLSTMLHHPVPATHNASPGLRPFCDVTETAVPPLQAGVSGGAADECPGAPEVDDAAAYAVQQISSQSNSLFPYTLKKVRTLCVCVPATAAPCCCHCTCYHCCFDVCTSCIDDIAPLGLLADIVAAAATAAALAAAVP
jgi:hypothetical protein